MTALKRNEATVGSADPSGLLDAYLTLPRQLTEAYSVGDGDVASSPPSSVSFCAMGGSAAAADVITAAFGEETSVPLVTARGYRLPGHAAPGALVVCISFSGNTEETLACFEEAVERRCRVVAVSSGGRLRDRAGSAGVPVIELPRWIPQPRAALGSLVGGCLAALVTEGALPDVGVQVMEAASTLRELASDLAPERSENEARAVAEWLDDAMPVVWGSEGVGAAAAWRWKCAFNENAKVPAFASSLPELDHHEIEGWGEGRGRPFRLVVLRHDGEPPSVERRVAATLEAVAPAGLDHRQVRARGDSAMARALWLMLLGDVASAYHALGRGLDPGPIPVIVRLKRRLTREGG